MMLDTGHHIWYHAHRQLVQDEFNTAEVLTTVQFNLVDWQMVHNTLLAMPRMFQVWACNQVRTIAPTNNEILRWTTQSPLCPSCMQVVKTCAHVLHCNHPDWVNVFQATVKLLNQWMKLRNGL